MSGNKSKAKRSNDVKSRIIARQADEIEKLKEEIAKLQNDNAEKEELVNSIEPMRKELSEIIKDLNDKRNEYDALLSQLKESRKIINQDVFKGKWNLIRFLLK